MPISFVCPTEGCEKKYKVAESDSGRKFTCKSCGQVVRIPGAATTSDLSAPAQASSRGRSDSSARMAPAHPVPDHRPVAQPTIQQLPAEMSTREVDGLIAWADTKTYADFQTAGWILVGLGGLAPVVALMLPLAFSTSLFSLLYRSFFVSGALGAGLAGCWKYCRKRHFQHQMQARFRHLDRMEVRLTDFLMRQSPEDARAVYAHTFSDETILALNSHLILYADPNQRVLKLVEMNKVTRIEEEKRLVGSQERTIAETTARSETSVQSNLFRSDSLVSRGSATTVQDRNEKIVYHFLVRIDTCIPEVGRLFLNFEEAELEAQKVAGLLRAALHS